MNKIQQLRELESQQLVLLNIMQKSDVHVFKCIKLGLNFAETYPEEEAEYVTAREQYNANEEIISNLKAEIKTEQETAIQSREELVKLEVKPEEEPVEKSKKTRKK